jgi:transcriptional regulator with XRE-family HTH domain
MPADGTAGQALARVNGKSPDVSVAAGREGFKAEVDDLRKLGMGYDEIAAEIARRYRLRPRESYRLAWGWSPGDAAARFNALAAHDGTAPAGRSDLTGPHLCEMERWPLAPSGGRKPSVYVLVMLAQMYETDVLSLLDLADHEHLAPQDRRTLLRPDPRPAGPFGERLVALMDERGLPLTEVARRIPCSPQHLSNIAHGRKGASEHLAGLLDRLLDAGGELVTLAATTEPPNRDERIPGTVPGSFGERLVALMDERGLSLREVDRRVPCSACYVSQLVHGHRRSSDEMACRLDDVLNAGGELAALAETTGPPDREERKPSADHDQRGDARPLASDHGLSLSLPFVPGRVVIEISDPDASAGQAASGIGYPHSAGGQLALVQDLPRHGQRDGRE